MSIKWGLMMKNILTGLLIGLALLSLSGCSAKKIPPTEFSDADYSHQGDKALLFTGQWSGDYYLVDFKNKKQTHLSGPFNSLGSWSPDDEYYVTLAQRSEIPQLTFWHNGALSAEPIRQPGLKGAYGFCRPAWDAEGKSLLFAVEVKRAGHLQPYVSSYDLVTKKSRRLISGSIEYCGNPFWQDNFICQRTINDDPVRRHYFIQPLAEPGRGEEKELLPDKFIVAMSVNPQGTGAIALCLPPKTGPTGSYSGPLTFYRLAAPEAAPKPLCTIDLFGPQEINWSAMGDKIVVSIRQGKTTEWKRAKENLL